MSRYVELYEKGKTKPYYSKLAYAGSCAKAISKFKIARSSIYEVADINDGALIKSKNGTIYKIVIIDTQINVPTASQINKIANGANKTVAPTIAPKSKRTYTKIEKEIQYHMDILKKYGNTWVSKTRSVTQIEPILEGLRKNGILVKETFYGKSKDCSAGWVLEKI